VARDRIDVLFETGREPLPGFDGRELRRRLAI